jgi:hypothetical protein
MVVCLLWYWMLIPVEWASTMRPLTGASSLSMGIKSLALSHSDNHRHLHPLLTLLRPRRNLLSQLAFSGRVRREWVSQTELRLGHHRNFHVAVTPLPSDQFRLPHSPLLELLLSLVAPAALAMHSPVVTPPLLPTMLSYKSGIIVLPCSPLITTLLWSPISTRGTTPLP